MTHMKCTNFMSYLDNTKLLAVSNLSIYFSNVPNFSHVVNNVSFELHEGQTIGIVGESSSGKSMTALAILGLLKYVGAATSKESSIQFKSSIQDKMMELIDLDEKTLMNIRGNEISMIFQEPMTSLNPLMTVRAQIAESLKLHQKNLDAHSIHKKILASLEQVRLPNASKLMHQYPHELSGGMRQRVMIAMAISCKPKILIADEPTTALDVTIQAQILQIIRELKSELNTSVLFISHDMGVISEMSDEVLVMCKGDKVEQNKRTDIFKNPQVEYTKNLLLSVPKIGSMKGTHFPQYFDIAGLDTQKNHAWKDHHADDSKPVLRVKNLTKHFDIKDGVFKKITHRVHAVENFSIDIFKGETVSLVGESGSGKTTAGKTIKMLLKPTTGTLEFHNQDMFNKSKQNTSKLYQKIQYIFQDPYASLNPRMKIGHSIAEPILLHKLATDSEDMRYQVELLLEKVRLEKTHFERYPHEFSGGQRQRICIARALACRPELIIADEIVSALDVSIQAEVLNLLIDLQLEETVSILFITHDMGVVERISHRVAVMYLGQIVEIGKRSDIFENPQHPYTKRLISSVPKILDDKKHQGFLHSDIPNAIRKIDNPLIPHSFVKVNEGHYVAENFHSFTF